MMQSHLPGQRWGCTEDGDRDLCWDLFHHIHVDKIWWIPEFLLCSSGAAAPWDPSLSAPSKFRSSADTPTCSIPKQCIILVLIQISTLSTHSNENSSVNKVPTKSTIFHPINGWLCISCSQVFCTSCVCVHTHVLHSLPSLYFLAQSIKLSDKLSTHK